MVIMTRGVLCMREKSEKGKRGSVFTVVYAAVFAALIAVLTMFPKIPIPGTAEGYVHLGDTAVYLAACALPLPWAAVSAGVGGAMADLLLGGAAWAPWTFFIKAAMTLFFTSKKPQLLCRRNAVAPAGALLVNAGGYFVAEWVMYGLGGAISAVIWNVAQSGASMAVFLALAAALDRVELKRRLDRNN